MRSKIISKMHPFGTSLVVQWLRLCAPNAGGPGSIPNQGTRSHMLQLRAQDSQIYKYIIIYFKCISLTKPKLKAGPSLC